MRKTPINTLITLAAAALLWFCTAILIGNYLGDRVALETVTTDAFVKVYRIILIAVAVLGFANCAWWFAYGARESTGGNVGAARRAWRLSLVLQLALAAAAVIALVIVFSNERFETVEYLLVFGAASLHAWLFFWLCTFFMSPRPVEYVPYGKG
jgi:hypothetical protein